MNPNTPLASDGFSQNISRLKKDPLVDSGRLFTQVVEDLCAQFHQEFREDQARLEAKVASKSYDNDILYFFESLNDAAIQKLASLVVYLEITPNPSSLDCDAWNVASPNPAQLFRDLLSYDMKEVLGRIWTGHIPYLMTSATLVKFAPLAHERLTKVSLGYRLLEDGSYEERSQDSKIDSIRVLLAQPEEAVSALSRFMWDTGGPSGALEQLTEVDPERVVLALNRLEGVLPGISDVSEDIVEVFRLINKDKNAQHRILLSDYLRSIALKAYELNKISAEEVLRLAGAADGKRLRLEGFASSTLEDSLKLLEIFQDAFHDAFQQNFAAQKVLTSIQSLIALPRSSWTNAMKTCFSKADNLVVAMNAPEKFEGLVHASRDVSDENALALSNARMLTDATILEILGQPNPAEFLSELLPPPSASQ